MKLLTVILYLLNVDGGQAEKVSEFRTMEGCEQSYAFTRSHGYRTPLLICVPVYKDY